MSMSPSPSEHQIADQVQRAWLLLAVGDDRQHGGNEGYDDAPESHYSWDSTVPNHASVMAGDAIAIWDKQLLLGASVIEEIEVGEAPKSLYSCTACGRASIKARRRLSPRYKCYSCKAVFEDPVKRETLVTTYRSRHDVGWVDLAGTLSGSDLRALCVNRSSQLSLRPLRWTDFLISLDQLPELGRLRVVTARADQLTGGHRTATVRVRVGQGNFRKRLLDDFGSVCAFTGPAPPPALEACHLYSYSARGEHHVHGGLLLRRDVHRLFDLGYLAVEPKTLTIDVAAPLGAFPIYAGLEGQALRTPVTPTHRQWFRDHWREHRTE
jgi:predicted RNA-binding Zn-ribbon protein involved in translation (DUF1610 family)